MSHHAYAPGEIELSAEEGLHHGDVHHPWCAVGYLLLFLLLVPATASCRRADSPPVAKLRAQPFTEPKSRWSVEELRELSTLLRRGEYADLERRLEAVQAAYEKDPLLELEPHAGFSTFYCSDPAFEVPLRRWTEARPHSYSAHLARGLYLARKGWLRRGYGSVGRTPPENFDRMREQFVAARAELERALALNPRLATADGELISIADSEPGHQEAKARLQHALDHNPLSYVVRRTYMGGLEPKWGGSREKMTAFAEEAQKYAARNPRLNLLKGFVAAEVDAVEAVRANDPNRALRYYDEALRHGDEPGFLWGRAQTLAALGRHQEAIALCTRVLEIRPRNLLTLRLRAEYRQALGQTEEALADLALGLSFDATDEDLLSFRAWLHEIAGRNDKSLADYDLALRVRPESPPLWASKGRLLVERLGKLEDGLRACRKAIELDQEDAAGWLCLGLAQSHQGNPEGRASLERSLKLSQGPAAYADLAYRYHEGRGVPKDSREAARLLEVAAEAGNVVAQTNLGFHYLNGDGVPKDYDKAARWFRSAAEAGNANAMCHLGMLYDQGWGLRRDYATAAEWYQKSVAGGYVHARFNLGLLYWDARGKKRDLVTAYRLLRGAADQGDADALKLLPELRGKMSEIEVEEGTRQLRAEPAAFKGGQ